VASRQRNYQRLLEFGLDWLNQQAQAKYGSNFAELDEETREARGCAARLDISFEPPSVAASRR
jgi:hypothetical protein